MVLISSSWWAAGGRVGRLRIWQRAQSRRWVKKENCLRTVHSHEYAHTYTITDLGFGGGGGCSLAKVVLDHKVRHSHVAEIEQREEVHRHVWELSETD